MFFLHGKFAEGVRTHLDGNLNDLGLFDRSRNLVRADRPAFESVVKVRTVVHSLRVTDLDEVAGRIGTLHHANAHAQGVVPEGQLLRGNDDASGSLGGFQVSSRVPMRQARVVFEIGVKVGPFRVGGGWSVGLFKTEIPGIRHAFEATGKPVETKRVQDLRFFLADLGDERLVLGSLCGFVDALLPPGETLKGFFHLFDGPFVFPVDGVLRFDAISLRLGDLRLG